MNSKRRILIAYQDVLTAHRLETVLVERNGHDISIAKNVIDVLDLCKSFMPDLMIIDPDFEEKEGGIKLVTHLSHQIPKFKVVYLSSSDQDDTFEKALETKPAGFIQAPYDGLTLWRTVALALLESDAEPKPQNEAKSDYFFSEKRFLIRSRDGSHKVIKLDEIAFIQSDRAYTKVVLARGDDFLLSKNLKSVSESINAEAPYSPLIRVHRSYIVNEKLITKLYGNRLTLSQPENKEIPIGKMYWQNLRHRFIST